MQLLEITQREIDTLGRKSTKWADKFENRPKLTRNQLWNRPWWEQAEYEGSNIDLSQELGPYLHKKGLKELGSGAFAVVYGRRGSNRVVKISTDLDKCWLKYANWAMGQHNNPHVPDIHHLESYTITTSGHGTRSGRRASPVFFAVMERLLPFAEEHINVEKNLPILAYLARYQGFDAFTKMQRGVGQKQNPFNRPHSYWSPDPKYMHRLNKFAGEGKKHPAVKLFRRVAEKWKNCQGDFHDGNIMIRPSTGEFVVTDPVADEGSGMGW